MGYPTLWSIFSFTEAFHHQRSYKVDLLSFSVFLHAPSIDSNTAVTTVVPKNEIIWRNDPSFSFNFLGMCPIWGKRHFKGPTEPSEMTGRSNIGLRLTIAEDNWLGLWIRWSAGWNKLKYCQTMAYYIGSNRLCYSQGQYWCWLLENKETCYRLTRNFDPIYICSHIDYVR